MSFIADMCSLREMPEPSSIDRFTCGDADLDEFFSNDCYGYAKQLLGKTYCCCLKSERRKVVCAFTLANASIRVDDLPNARKKKIEADIPHAKSLKDYPSVLIGRLGVSQDFHSMHIGSEVLEYIKYWFLDPNNKTGCRFVIVDAYNAPATKVFYERNGFKTVFSTDDQEKIYRHVNEEVPLSTRLMYFDLMSLTQDNM